MVKRFVLALCLASAFACDKDDGPSSPFAPTPAGDPQPTAKLMLNFLPRAGNEFRLVITSDPPNLLDSALAIWPPMDPNTESWSGALLCIIDNTGATSITKFCTNTPFEPRITERFTFASVSSRDPLDFSMVLVAGGGRKLEHKVLLYPQYVQANSEAYQIRQQGRDHSIIGPLLR